MSGKIVNNVFRASGVIAATPGGLDWSTAVVTGSTLTATAGKGYFINTTSNACTVTLPSSAEIGDQIVFADYARTWSTNNVIIDSNGLNFQGDPDTYTVDYDTAGQSLNIVYSDATKGWLPVSDDAVAFDHTAPPTQKGIFAYGNSGSDVSLSNIVSSSGVIASDVTGVGTGRSYITAASYGTDKAIFGYGSNNAGAGGQVSMTNLVSNSGVVSTDVTGVGTARFGAGSAGYGTDKAIFAYGRPGTGQTSLSNLVSNSGVVASDVTGVGSARSQLGAASYGTDKAIFGYGYVGGAVSMTNLVSNTGVVGSDVSGVGSARYGVTATNYGVDKAIFGYGYIGGGTSITNLVSNTGVVSANVTGVGTVRNAVAATNYGGDKAIFAYGSHGTTGAKYNMSNLVNNLGVVSADVTGVGTARSYLGAAGFSTSA
jgi:hypothetical protein